jgi:hypothetical protein
MNLSRNSKLLAKASDDNYYVMIYHNTPVVHLDKITSILTMKHSGWETKATAAAINYALDDIYGAGQHRRVRLLAGELSIDGFRVNDGEIFNYGTLEE